MSTPQAKTPRKPESLFHNNVSWAFRTSVAAALGFLLVPSPQTIFVLPFFCAVISIACCQRTIGQTLIYCFDTFVGSLLGTILASISAYILLRESQLAYEIALPILIFIFIIILSHPKVPAKPFAFTLLFLGLGVPLDSSAWYFGFSLFGTTVLGIFAAIIANLLPLLHPRTGYRQMTALLFEAEALTQTLLLQLVNVTKTNDTLETVTLVRGCRHLAAIIAELESLQEPARVEMQMCCRRRQCSEYQRRVRLLVSQGAWLDGMRHAVEQRQGEPILKDQQRFIELCIPSYLLLVGAVGEAMVHSDEPINSKRILSLLDDALATFLQARIEVFYNPMFENGQVVLPVLIHSLRRGVFVFHMARLCEQITQSPVVPVVKTPFKLTFPYKHPIKMALALVVASFWFVLPGLKGSVLGKGIWIGITICFLSSADFGSSVTKSMDRLQGSLLACAFSVITIRIVGNNLVAAAVMMCAWVFATSFFRGATEHGYAALVAAFTSPVLLFGGVQFIGSTAMESFILARVEMTAIGVAVYLAIQAFIWPVDPVSEIEEETANWFDLAAKFAATLPPLIDPSMGADSPKRSLSSPSTDQETQRLSPPPCTLETVGAARSLCLASVKRSKATVYAAAASPMPHRRAFAHVAYLNLLAKQERSVVHMTQISEALSHLGEGEGTEDQIVMQVLHECAVLVATQLATAAALVQAIKHSAGWEAMASDDVVKTTVALRQFGLLHARVVHLWGEFLHDAYLRRNPGLVHSGQLSPLGPDPFQTNARTVQMIEVKVMTADEKVLTEANPVDCAKFFQSHSSFRSRSLESRLKSQQRLIASSAIISGLSELCATLAKAGADIETIYF